MRYFIDLTYKGTAYHGWQLQKNAISVQQVINEALSLILRESVETVGSGRTDTGVHAYQQVAHFDVTRQFRSPSLVHTLNSYLPKDIAIRSLRKVIDTAHARYDAVERSYEYKIVLEKDPFLEFQAYHLKKMPDLELMNRSANVLITTGDFESFSKVKTNVASFNCKITHATWEMIDNLLVFSISADRFLRGMVRALVGTMLDVGYKKMSTDEFVRIIDARDRRKAGIAAPAHGLYLNKIIYPDKIYLS